MINKKQQIKSGDYRQNMSIVQFVADLIWNLNENEIERNQAKEDLIVKSLGSLIKVNKKLDQINFVLEFNLLTFLF
jgi:hypothetical protein